VSTTLQQFLAGLGTDFNKFAEFCKDPAAAMSAAGLSAAEQEVLRSGNAAAIQARLTGAAEGGGSPNWPPTAPSVFIWARGMPSPFIWAACPLAQTPFIWACPLAQTPFIWAACPFGQSPFIWAAGPPPSSPQAGGQSPFIWATHPSAASPFIWAAPPQPRSN
jgi:hypothetical protein